MKYTGRGERLARLVNLLDDASAPLGLDNAVAVKVAVFAAIEFDAADDCRLWCAGWRVRVARDLDEFAAVLGNVEGNAFNKHLVRALEMVACWCCLCNRCCNVAEMAAQFAALVVVALLLLLQTRLLDGLGQIGRAHV